MKKYFLLLLAALLCVGCSKEMTRADENGMAQANSSQMVGKTFNYMVDPTGLINNSYVEYTNLSGEVEMVPWTTTLELQGSDFVLHIDIRTENGNYDKIYCAVRAWNGDPYVLRNLTDDRPINATIPVGGIDSDYIELWASLEDWTQGELD